MLQNILIQKVVPIPAPARRRHSLPFIQMGVGDSFFVAGNAKDHRRVRANMSNFMRLNPGWKFATRSLSENGVEGVRVWRIA